MHLNGARFQSPFFAANALRAKTAHAAAAKKRIKNGSPDVAEVCAA
jgi:hypothetical protein